jgi:putative transposase
LTNRIYEYRLYPRKRERQALEILLEQSREVYNAALQQCKNAYEATQTRQSAINQWDYFREWRQQAGILLNASSLQQVLRRLDKAYSSFFRRLKAGETPGYPRFKGANDFKSVDYGYGDGCKLNYQTDHKRFTLYIQNVGDIKVKLHRSLPGSAKIKRLTLKRKASGWYVYLTLQVPDPALAEPNGLPEVGGDMGLLRLLTLSDGTEIDNPRWLRHALAALRIAQRRLARRVKGSNRRQKARRMVALLHEHVATMRRAFWHKVTYWLVHHYGLIALENLTLDFMLRNARLSLSAHDAGLGLFQDFLQYKALDAGAVLRFVNPAYTSQVCSGCGEIVTKDLSVRVHSCPHCHLELDRDVNAARNILYIALNAFSPPGSGGQALT